MEGYITGQLVKLGKPRVGPSEILSNKKSRHAEKIRSASAFALFFLSNNLDHTIGAPDAIHLLAFSGLNHIDRLDIIYVH